MGERLIQTEELWVEVVDEAPPGVAHLRLDLHRPAGLDRGPLLVCLPGGGIDRRYFDLPDRLPGDWSMAHYLADRFDLAVAVLDHPGVGESDVPHDPYVLNPRTVAKVDLVGIAEFLASLAEYDGFVVTELIGCGHSMGAMLVAQIQWRYRYFDSIALLGFGGAGLADLLTDRERSYAGDYDALESVLPDLVRSRFGTAIVAGSTTSSDFLNPNTVPDARELLGTAATGMLALCGLTSMIPGTSDAALASVTVPVFLGLGEHDIAGDIEAVAELFTSGPPIERFVLPGAGHNHSIARNRTELWDALGGWITARGRR